MENKYYTPLDEEFHIGFEYEALQDERSPNNNSSWSKCDILTPEELEHVGRNLWKNYSELRVKYLDKEDIESLGFEEYDINWFRKKIFEEYPGYYYIVPTTFYGNNSYIIDTDIIIVDIEGKYERLGNRERLFSGVIKNKSELNILLKQLRIK